jgi:hypothetical protein
MGGMGAIATGSGAGSGSLFSSLANSSKVAIATGTGTRAVAGMGDCHTLRAQSYTFNAAPAKGYKIPIKTVAYRETVNANCSDSMKDS